MYPFSYFNPTFVDNRLSLNSRFLDCPIHRYPLLNALCPFLLFSYFFSLKMGGVKLDRWGYEVKTSSDSCISAINAYYHQVLALLHLLLPVLFVWIGNSLFWRRSLVLVCKSLLSQVLSNGRNRKVILEAPAHDKDCVLANILAAQFLSSSDPSKAPSLIEAAKAGIVIFSHYIYGLSFESTRILEIFIIWFFVALSRSKPRLMRKPFLKLSIIWFLRTEMMMLPWIYTPRYSSRLSGILFPCINL